ncbi:cyclase family protein [Actinoplanes subtropicus]|uniref:cyclase family protein n=1 Tax=Actinoplanes subtropicus TaxID=543632 RepID=UPI00069191FB|nr:cyclase family protein [Actinoplanes subtropicus]
MATGSGKRIAYDQLSSLPHGIEGCAWGVWGADDEVGAFNDVGREEVLAALATVRTGDVFALSWNLRLPEPALYGRGPLRHTVRDDGFGMDDHLDGFYPQASSQWDSLAHFAHPVHRFYGGRPSSELKGPGARNGIDNLARRGIVGRFVLADLDRWRRRQGRPIDHDGGEPIALDDLTRCLSAQGSTVRHGDVLLVRFGWITWYEGLSTAVRKDFADNSWSFKAAGIAPDAQVPRWLWDSGVVAVVADNVSFEALPFDPRGQSLHANLISLLGMPIGEMWALDALAEDCARDGRYEGLLMSAPLYLTGGTGSTANAVAVK